MNPQTVLKSVIALMLVAFLPAHDAVAPSAAVRPEEGMWTFDNLPLKQLKEKYGFEPSPEWIEHVRLGSVRFDTGGSGSFVSPNGLVMTNHHVALTTIQSVSSAEHDYVTAGFSARTFGSEVKCKEEGKALTLRQLLEIKDVTKEVMDASKAARGAQLAQARAQAAASLAKEIKTAAAEKAGPSVKIEADVVPLYNGSEFHVYVYRLFDDIRLVFAPEKQCAFYGGDPDNFTYPRYCLDCAFFRVYEDNKPFDSSKFYFKWNSKGAAEDELVFCSGHPGGTERLQTFAQLEFARDAEVPTIIALLKARADSLGAYSQLGAEQRRVSVDEYFGIKNSLKAYEGHLAGLLDVPMMAKKKAAEDDLIEKANSPDVELAFMAIGLAQQKAAKMFPRSRLARIPGITGRRAPSAYERFLRSVVDGKAKPDAELPPLGDLDRLLMLNGLKAVKARLDPKDPFIVKVFGDRSADEVAKAIGESKMFDVAYRTELAAGGREAIRASTDPLIVAIREGSQVAAETASKYDREVTQVETKAFDTIAKARFKVYGKTINPDATFTLRLSYGTVKGYEAGTTEIPYKTTFTGLYERSLSHDNKPPYDLPKRWVDRKDKLDLTTPFNFVCTTDIIGGNSGSPILNRAAEIVGLVFDGNIESLPGNYWFDERVNRTVAVHSASMPEALNKVYDEHALVKELLGG